jgi:hypothetical protein
MDAAPFEVTVERITFLAGGDTLVGHLQVPAGPGARPLLVFLGPLTSVKEQVPGNYARAMAARGFLSLAFDNRHFGESGGSPRQLEDPSKKIEDVRAAIDALVADPRVDAARIGAVGVCAGAGYMAGAVATEPRIRAFGAVAGFFHDARKQREWMGDGFEAALARARAAREAFEGGAGAAMIPAVGEGEVAMPLAEAFEYYGTPRGAHPNYINAFAVMSRERTLPYDAQRHAPAIRVPTLMVHSERALAPALARSFFAALGGPKEERWVESRGQIDFYDDPALIDPVADGLQGHFARAFA